MADNDKKSINTLQDSHLPRTRRNWPSIQGNDKERASRGLSRLEGITRLISEMVWEIDSEGRISYISDRVFETLGFLPIQIIGQTFNELGSFYSQNNEVVTVNWNNPFREVIFKTVNSNDEEKILLISGIPYYAPDSWDYEGVSGTARDITNQIKSENELKDALKKAEWANQAKTEFLSTISHELRTPLTSIKGSIGLIQGLKADELSKEVLGLLEITNRNSETLLTLINEMLDYERILSGLMTIELSSNNVTELVRNEIKQIENYSSSLDIKIDLAPTDDDFMALLNAHRFGQILRNLLSNAAKFSNQGDEIIVAINRIGKNISISVTDHGVGISDEDKPKIFERFIQADSSDSRKYNGSGLGLSISKALTLSMGGNISFTSEVGKGSVFTVEFPEATG